MAALIASLASSAFWSTSLFKAVFSSSVNGDLEISAFLPATALSMAALATSLSIANVPSSIAFLTSSLVLAVSIASCAFLASESIWSLATCLSSSVKLLSWSIAFFASSTAVLRSLVACSLASDLVGTSIELISLIPLSSASVTVALVVALSMAVLAAFWASLTSCFNAAFSSSVKFEESIALFFASAASATAFLAVSLAADSAGTVILSIALIPWSCASVTAVFVVAASIALSAAFCASATSCFNAAFSSFVKSEESIALFLASAASATAFLAASLAADSVGTSVSLIFLIPFSCAVVTASGVVAALIASLASSAFWSTSLFKAAFSSSVKDDLEISAFLPATALSIAALAISLSMASLPLSTALLTSSSVVALSIASCAFLASESIWSLAACFSSSVKLLSWSIAFLASSTSLLRSVVACSLAGDLVGIWMSLIAAMPFSLAVVTASSVVALVIFDTALLYSAWTLSFKLFFSSVVKSVALSIALFLASRAAFNSSIASCCFWTKVGIAMLLMFSKPAVSALFTASLVWAALISLVASSAALLVWSTKACFSWSVKWAELLISFSLAFLALSIALRASVCAPSRVGINRSVICLIASSRVAVTASLVVVDESLILAIASLAILSTWSLNSFCSSVLKLVAAEICLFLASWTCLIALMASCLTWSKLGTVTLAISAIPLFCASVTASLVVALLILSFAFLATSVAWLIKSCFSSVLKLDALLISSVLTCKALSIAVFAAFLASSSEVKVIPLMLSIPALAASRASSLVVAFSTLFLAVVAASFAWSTNFCFSVSFKLEALLISFTLEFNASSIAWLAFFFASSRVGIVMFSMFWTPVVAAALASSFVWAWLMLLIASVAALVASLIKPCFSSWERLEALLISLVLASKALLIRSILSFLTSDKFGTVTSAIAFSPFVCAVSTSALVVALLILFLAALAASVAWLIKSVFSWALILDALLISSVFFWRASLMAAIALSLAEEVVGISVLLISFTPFVCAVVTSSTVVALAIFCFALFASELIKSV